MRMSVTALLALLMINAPALAGPGAEFADWAQDLHLEATLRANDAAARPAAPADPLDIEDPFFFELEQFAVDALRLSRLLRDNNGPGDLQCIFRGISNDASARIDALNDAESAGAQARIYRQLAALMNDAAAIAPAIDDSEIPEASIDRKSVV